MRARSVILATMLALTLPFAAAALSRPTRQDFETFVYAQMLADATSEHERATVKRRAETYLAGCRFHSRVLWTRIDQFGTPAYTGAFGRFFEQAQPQQRTTIRPYRYEGRVIYLVDASAVPAPPTSG